MQAISYILHTMDPSNLIMRKACIISSMMALREIARVFPMVALNESMTRLAVGDAIGEIHNATIRVYDIERYVGFQVAESCFRHAVKLCIFSLLVLNGLAIYSFYLLLFCTHSFNPLKMYRQF